MAKHITNRDKDYSQWYLDVIREAKLADHSPVRGSLSIRPTGNALRQNSHAALDKMSTDTGHENAYYPLEMPKAVLTREAQHVEGLAKECATVTLSRLKRVECGVIVDPVSQ